MTGRGQPLNPRELRRQTLPRRMLNLEEAALYLGVGSKLLARLVKQGRAPEPKLISTGRSQVRKFDIRELDDFADRLPTGDADGRPTPAPRRLLSF
jgi:hypothetical protein